MAAIKGGKPFQELTRSTSHPHLTYERTPEPQSPAATSPIDHDFKLRPLPSPPLQNARRKPDSKTTDVFTHLEPKLLWDPFRSISAIPRPSKQEKLVADFIAAQGHRLNYKVMRDAVNNVAIDVPASKGYEEAPLVGLQGHTDIVTEVADGVQHDMSEEGPKFISYYDAISPRENDDPDQQEKVQELLKTKEGREQLIADRYKVRFCIKAQGTTAGFDDGMGVAAMLALLDDPHAVHGPLRLIFTADEEDGFGGAKGLQAPMLEGLKYILNLDEEEEGVFTIGCAGGENHYVQMKLPPKALAGIYETFEVSVGGLSGGHSGAEIHKGKANANKALGDVLGTMQKAGAVRIVSLSGGNKINAIPRNARAVVAIHPDRLDAVKNAIADAEARLKAAHRKTDPNLGVNFKVAPRSNESFSRKDSKTLVRLIRDLPSGVHTMEDDKQQLVRTSSNLGNIKTENNVVTFGDSARSLVEADKIDFKGELSKLAARYGAKLHSEKNYPGWTPQWDSPFIPLFSSVYGEVIGGKPTVRSIHAGLELGEILGRFESLFPSQTPPLMGSFGPTVEHAHSPLESVVAATVPRFYNLLKVTLKRLAITQS
jgi:dipeptidase D